MRETDYMKVRAERKAKAEEVVTANAKAATAAKAKAQGKVTAKADAEFDKALSKKQAARSAGWKRSTNLPVQTSQEGE